MDSIMIGQLQEAEDLGIDPSEVGCGSCGGGCKVGEVDEDFFDEPDREEVGRGSPKYSRALRQRLMACRADCESNLVSGADEFLDDLEAISGIDDYIDDDGLDEYVAGLSDDEVADEVIEAMEQDPVVGLGFFKRIGRAFKKAGRAIAKVARKVIAHPVFKAVAAGVSVVFPPAAPFAAAAIAADKVISAIENKDPAGAIDAVATASSAASGNMGAIQSIKQLASKGLNTKLPGLKPLVDMALQNGPTILAQKVLSNPNVQTSTGVRAIPGPLAMAIAKLGPQAGLAVAQRMLPAVRPIAITTLDDARQTYDAMRGSDPAATAKAVARVAATTAAAKAGDANAVRGLGFMKQVKSVSTPLPNIKTQLSHGRVEVCGAKSEESRGIWLKAHVYREGRFLHATLYSVAAADVEVFNLKVDLLPFIKYATQLHKKAHAISGTDIEVGALIPTALRTAQNLGRAALAQKAFAVSADLAKKTACRVQTPNVPTSNATLAALAAARTGVAAVDNNKKLSSAMEKSATNLYELAALKKKLMAMTPAQRAIELKNPSVRAAVLKGIGSKFAIKKFVVLGGAEKAAQLRKTANVASSKFATLAKQAKAGNPDAKKMAKIVGIAAKTRAKTQATLQNNEGGMAGLVIDAKGKVRRAKKFMRRVPKAGEKSQVLIPRHGRPQTGIFTAVAGSPKVVSQARLASRLRKIRQLAVVSGMDIGLIGPQGEMDLESVIPYDQYVEDPFKEYVPLYQNQGV